ncbi:MAG: LysR family transcriptional regulator [Pseudomonadota bacterium]
MLNWNDLGVFLAIAERGTLAGAARDLGVNHSTVFRRLGKLEQALEARLFERLPEGYALTSAGQALLPHARAADGAVADILREVAGHDAAPAGPVRITTAPNLAHTVLPHAVAMLRSRHPGIEVRVAVSDSDADLMRREADIALRATARPPEPLVGRRVATLPWWVVAAADYPDPPATVDAMAGHPLIGPGRSLERLAAFGRPPGRPPYVATANELLTMAALARTGIGLALLPADHDDPGLKRLFPLPDVVSELWLLTHPDLIRIRRVRAVWETVLETTRGRFGPAAPRPAAQD